MKRSNYFATVPTWRSGGWKCGKPIRWGAAMSERWAGGKFNHASSGTNPGRRAALKRVARGDRSEGRGRMTGRVLRTLPVVLALAIAGGAGWATRANGDENGKTAAFERFKQLAGEWTAKGEGEETRVTYKVTSGGTAVV